MTLPELSALVDMMREKGVASLTDGAVQVILGPEPRPRALEEPRKPEPKEAPIGPNGKPMSAYDRVLFASSIGDDEEAVQ